MQNETSVYLARVYIRMHRRSLAKTTIFCDKKDKQMYTRQTKKSIFVNQTSKTEMETNLTEIKPRNQYNKSDPFL